MNVLTLIQAILAAAPQELALVEAMIQITKGTHTVVPMTPNPIPVQTETAAPIDVPTETAATVVPPNGKKVTL